MIKIQKRNAVDLYIYILLIGSKIFLAINKYLFSKIIKATIKLFLNFNNIVFRFFYMYIHLSKFILLIVLILFNIIPLISKINTNI